MNSTLNPLLVRYLYVHGDDETFFYPTARSSLSAATIALGIWSWEGPVPSCCAGSRILRYRS